MAKEKFGFPVCPICKSKQDVTRVSFNIIQGKLEQIFYCSDCDQTFPENVDLLEKIYPRYEQWGRNSLTVVAY
jgi:transposase-like protein